MKSLKTPPPILEHVYYATLLILTNQLPDNPVTDFLRLSTSLDRLINRLLQKSPESINLAPEVRKTLDLAMNNPFLDIAAVRTSSGAAVGLYKWAKAWHNLYSATHMKSKK